MHSASVVDEDRTARARIRDAAIARFAEQGVKGTSLKEIAADAGVSPALVVHHFGSKAALRTACDEHVAAAVREGKQRTAAQGLQMDPLAALRDWQGGAPLLRYLATTLTDGAPHVRDLVDEMIDDAEGYMALGVETGMLKPSDRPRERAVVLTVWSLGALVLHEHLKRHLGGDMTAGLEGMAAYGLPASEILTKGVLADELYERVRDAFAETKEEGT